jgi:cephalosporin-C deacetylase-like acetyl esterase
MFKSLFHSGFTFILFILILLPDNVTAQDQNELDVISNWLQYRNAHYTLYDYLSEEAYEQLRNRQAAVQELKSQDDWIARQEWIKRKLQEIIGPFPPKTPLNAKVVKTISKEDYRIEHIVFESQPGFYITSSLFIPEGINAGKRTPAIIYCSGHTPEAYRSQTYQHVVLNLVSKGFIVFAFDPVGQGERLQYYDPQTDQTIVGPTTREHSYISAQLFISGSSLAKYVIWDGIRAVDYLLTREEVDSERIGITGRSGGGFQSAYIAALDSRILASAPENHISNYTRILQSIGPRDGEQNLFHMFLNGIDHADFLTVRAPKPTMMITTVNDMFSIQGSGETAEEIHRAYKACQAEENFVVVEDVAGHTSTKKNREAMYEFFQTHLDFPGNPHDEGVELLSKEELRVSPTGQVSSSWSAKSVYDLNREATDKQMYSSGNTEDPATFYQDMLESAKSMSGFQKPAGIPESVFTGRIEGKGFRVDKYFIEGEGDYPVPYLVYVPQKLNGKSVICLYPSGKGADIPKSGEVYRLVRKGYLVLVPDLIGTGETSPEGWNTRTFFNHAGFTGISYPLWYMSVLTGRTIVGIRAGDLLRLVNVLQRDFAPKEIYGIAREEMSAVLIHAAAFDSAISRIALLDPIVSYMSMVMEQFYSPAYVGNAVPGAIRYYDLPDLAASLAPRKLLLVDPLHEAAETDSKRLNHDISLIKKSYIEKGSANNLIIGRSKVTEKMFELWLK